MLRCGSADDESLECKAAGWARSSGIWSLDAAQRIANNAGDLSSLIWRLIMPKTLTAREHWHKAFDYFWKGDRRRTIKEARLAMKLNPNYVRPHWIIGSVYLSTEPVDCEAALKEFRELVRKDPR